MNPETIQKMQDNTRALRNDELVKAFNDLRGKEKPTPQQQAAYLSAMEKARFIAPVALSDTNKDDTQSDEGRLQVRFSHVKNKEGHAFFMAFTDMDTLLKNAKDDEKLQVLGVTFNDFAIMLRDPHCKMEGFVINPFTENIIIGKQQLESISRFITIRKVEDGEMAAVGEFKDIPEDALKPFEKYFDMRGDVKKAYLLSMKKGKNLNRLIVVDIAPETDFKTFTEELKKNVLDIDSVNDPKMPYIVMNFAEKNAPIITREKVPFYVKV